MGNRRHRPKLMPAKLLAIREFLNLTQAKMAAKLQSEILSSTGRQYQVYPAGVSKYENDKREPNLSIIIAYGRLGDVHLESLIADDVTLETLRSRLGREGYCVPSSQRKKKRTNSRKTK